LKPPVAAAQDWEGHHPCADPDEPIQHSRGPGACLLPDCWDLHTALHVDRRKDSTTITVDIAHRINYFRDFGVANALGVFSYLLVLITAVYYLRSSVRKMTGYQASEG